MANALEGEREWKFGRGEAEQVYTLRLTMRDLRALEEETDVPMMKWRQKLIESNFGIRETDAILRLALRRGDPERTKRWKNSDIDDILEKAGSQSSALAAVQILNEALRDPEERAEAAEAAAEEDHAVPLNP